MPMTGVQSEHHADVDEYVEEEEDTVLRNARKTFRRFEWLSFPQSSLDPD